jgi:hypothetical protein
MEDFGLGRQHIADSKVRPGWPSTRWETIVGTTGNATHREPWNKGKVVGQKAPFKPKDIWALHVRQQMEGRVRELALFYLRIDSNLRGRDLGCSEFETSGTASRWRRGPSSRRTRPSARSSSRSRHLPGMRYGSGSGRQRSSLPRPAGIVGPMVNALAVLSAIGRVHRAARQNHRYHFTTWCYGRAVLGLVLLGLVLRVALLV